MRHFEWEAYGKALISNLGFDPRNWVKTNEQVKGDAREQQEMMAEVQTQGAVQQGIAQGAGAAAAQMAPQVMEQVMTGGAAPVQGGA